jgi:hypothetical protein
MNTLAKPGVRRERGFLQAVRELSIAKISLLLFVSLVGLYHVNRTLVEEGDSIANIDLPMTLLKRGTLSFHPDSHPELFKWKSTPPLIVTEEFFVRRWFHIVGDKSLEQWRKDGHLSFNGPRYNVVESKRRNAFLSTFGPIPGLTFVPLSAMLLYIDPEFENSPLLVLSAAKLQASMMVATTTVLLFLMALTFLPRKFALLIAVAYGIGTCAWSIASQNLWQQTVNTLFLSLGCLFFLRAPDKARSMAISGAALGTAMACRSTSAIFVLAVAVYLALYHRKSLIGYALGAIPIPAAIAFYNYYYFGSPISFGQELAGHTMALEKTNNPALWQTPLLEGLLGLLISPSRGLLIFSPFIAVSALGIARIWRDARYRVLRPLTVAAIAIMALQCKWFDWWGGWTYGYRPWLDVVPLLVLFMVPVLEGIWQSKAKKTLFAGALVWSCLVQALGAFAYDKSWNDREVFMVEIPGGVKPIIRFTEANAERLANARGGTYRTMYCNIDFPECRRRLWSHEDSIIAYHFSQFGVTRKRRYDSAWGDLSVFRNF